MTSSYPEHSSGHGTHPGPNGAVIIADFTKHIFPLRGPTIGGAGDPPAIDPIIADLLKRLPKSGATWPKAQRKLWLQLLEGSFDLIYDHQDVMK